MAGSVNKVILAGNLGKDPEVHNSQIHQRHRERPSLGRVPEWHRVVIFNERLSGVLLDVTRQRVEILKYVAIMADVFAVRCTESAYI